jgi:hypothetical protein
MMKWVRYVGGFLLFLVSYGIVATIARVLVAAVNSDAQGWISDVVPFFVAALAGGIGAVGGLVAVERFMPSVRLRPIAWTFIGVVIFLYAFTALGMIAGNVPEKGLSEMATQALVAVIITWRFSGRSRIVRP